MDNIRISRREMIKISGVVGALLVGGRLLKNGVQSSFVTVRESRLLMGTIINLSIIAGNFKDAQDAVRSCFDRMTYLESVFSRFNPESQLSKLNQFGTVSANDPVFGNLIRQALKLSEITAGAYDITIKPVLDLYLASQGLPSGQAIGETLPLVDYRNVHVNNQEVWFEKPGMEITLDSIAKGFIVDEAVLILDELGIGNVLVEAGGDLLANGTNLDQSPWRIGIQSPRHVQSDLIAKVRVSGQAVATSGDYMHTFTNDYVNHHILDPRTGYSAPDLASVSVLAPSAMMADGLATALMVMGFKDGLSLINNLPSYEAFFVTKTLNTTQSIGFPIS